MTVLTFPQPGQPADLTANSPDRWLVRLSSSSPGVLLRIFCFPWSGAGASAYRAHAGAVWAQTEIVGIQLPGRGTRRSESAFTRLEAPAEQAAQAIRADLQARPSPFALLGHSYGALLAYETARLLEAGELTPEAAVLSASRAPDTPPPVPLHRLDDLQLARQLGRMGGLSPDRLRDPAFMEYLLPIARSDLTACETYAPVGAQPLTCPVISWAGDDDWYAPPADVARWQHYAGFAYRHREFPDGHFFINDVPAVTSALLADLHRVRFRESTRTPSSSPSDVLGHRCAVPRDRGCWCRATPTSRVTGILTETASARPLAGLTPFHHARVPAPSEERIASSWTIAPGFKRQGRGGS